MRGNGRAADANAAGAARGDVHVTGPRRDDTAHLGSVRLRTVDRGARAGTTGLGSYTTSATVVFRDADAAITYAYGHFFDPALTSDERATLIQGSAGMRDFIDSSFTRHEGEAAAGAVIADHIAVNGATADVSFHALYGGHESPANPGQLRGTAVLEDGAWKISRATFCMLSAGDGEVCPPASIAERVSVSSRGRSG